MKSLPYSQHLCNASMGIAGEAGEVVDLLKKHVFHGKMLDLGRLREEIGDTLFYLAALANRFNLDLAKIMDQNTEKLMKRFPNGFNHEDANARRDEVKT